MEHTGLILGFLFAVGAFAVKGGAGGHYYLAGRSSPRAKVFFLLAYYLVYLILFLGIGLAIDRVDLRLYLGPIQEIMGWAMPLHLLISTGLIAWGVVLLRPVAPDAGPSRGWLALVIPCPVCLSVILITLAFLKAYFPDHYLPAIFIAYGAYVLIHGASVLTLSLVQKHAQSPPEQVLGAAMLILAAYFLLSIFIMPAFAEMERIYRLAAYQGQGDSPPFTLSIFTYSLIAAAFAAGALRQIIFQGGRESCR